MRVSEVGTHHEDISTVVIVVALWRTCLCVYSITQTLFYTIIYVTVKVIIGLFGICLFC